MPWIILKFDPQPDQLSRLETLLSNAGAGAVTFEDNADQPLFEPPLGSMPVWENTRLSAMFEANADIDNIVALIRSQFGHNMPRHRVEVLEDKDWVREWMDEFHPIQFGTRLWVCPSWRKPPDDKAVNMLLDPGLAFGTGTHPTTALCLKWLDSQPLTNRIVVDYGCGSGILAVAAKLLGARSVWAVDNDPQALIATKANAERNNISAHIQAVSPQQFEKEFIAKATKADILLANILAGPLIHLAATLEKSLKLNGKLVLSGILKEQAENVKNHYQQWFTIDTTVSEDDWVRITGFRTGTETGIND
ncbi:MAG: 50S ribosomal protein L11 methyltransferase [Pseudomonadales bacterium]|nr:50S ribosomal protein L11 methyltransferase [Pseudomonadales bacterium]